VGGFHLAVDATNDAAVRRLRTRKHRDAKPLAIMVRTLDEARAIAHVSEREATALRSSASPVVLLRPRDGSRLAGALAPGLDRVGVMLAYTPLHHLLLSAANRPLVMTSGNLSEEPIAIGLDEGRTRLRPLVDAFLLHDREILSRCDDSVLRVAGTHEILLRRARGYAPVPLALPVASPQPLIAVGPHLKNTFALARHDRAFVSPHIGDLEGLEALEHWRQAYDRYRELFRVEPTVAVRDLHPGYLSTRLAEELGLARTIAVQHHHAHVAAVAAEQRARGAGDEAGFAQRGPAFPAGQAVAAIGREHQGDMVAALQSDDAGAELFDDAGGFMAEHHGHHPRPVAVDHGQVRVAKPGTGDAHQTKRGRDGLAANYQALPARTGRAAFGRGRSPRTTQDGRAPEGRKNRAWLPEMALFKSHPILPEKLEIFLLKCLGAMVCFFLTYICPEPAQCRSADRICSVTILPFEA